MARLGVTQQTAIVRDHAEEIARSLLSDEPPPPPSGCRVLIVLMGPPASGKSHFGRLLAALLGGVVVASDAVRRKLFVAPSYARGETRTVFALTHALMRLLLAAGHTVVADATNLAERDRHPLYALAARAGAGLLLVRISAPDEVIRARLRVRAARASEEDKSEADARVYEMLRGRYQEPGRPYLMVDASGDLGREVERIAEEARRSCA